MDPRLSAALEEVHTLPLTALTESGIFLDRVNHNPEAARYFLAYGDWAPVSEELVLGNLDPATAEHTQIYVDFPFCKTLCNFCAFYPVIAKGEDQIASYITDLKREVLLVGERYFSKPGVRAETIELGGGTPTVTPLPLLRDVVDLMFETFPMAGGKEHNFEATPDSVVGPEGIAKLEYLRNRGFSRVSLGVQSFDDAVLKQMNRSHVDHHTTEAIANVRKLGFDRVNFDLMLGVPQQPPEDLLESVQRSIDLGIEILELYTMRYFDTKRHVPVTTKVAKDEELLAAPDMILAARIAADRMLRAAGYRSYNGRTYQKDAADFYAPYYKENFLGNNVLGLGRKSHSNVYPYQYGNYRNLEKYHASLAAGRLPIAAGCVLPPKARLAKLLTGALQLSEPIPFSRTISRFTPEEAAPFEELRQRFETLGLVETRGETSAKTMLGFLFVEEMLKAVYDLAVTPFDASRPFLGKTQSGTKVPGRLVTVQ